MDEDTYAALRRQARPLARNEAEAEDLVQDTLLAALLARRQEARWLAGVLRNLARMQARGGTRRRAREALFFEDPAALEEDITVELPELPPMPAAARRVARFALHGLDADEIRWLLGVTPAALRQRTASIRRALQSLPQARQRLWHEAVARHQPLRAPGPLRRALKAAIGPSAGLASHDPDGHPLVLRNGAHAWAPRGNQGTPQPTE